MPKDDSVLIGEPSPQIYPTSKTLARQSKDLAIARKEKDFQMSEEMILYGSVQNEFEKELAQEPEAALDRESVEDPPEYYNK